MRDKLEIFLSRLSNKKMILFAVTAFLLGGSLMWSWKSDQLAKMTPEEKITVVVAKSVIERDSEIVASDLGLEEFLVSNVPDMENVYTSMDEVIGQNALGFIDKGDPITLKKVGRLGDFKESEIPATWREVGIPITNLHQLSGVVYPGADCDLVFTDILEGITYTYFKNAIVTTLVDGSNRVLTDGAEVKPEKVSIYLPESLVHDVKRKIDLGQGFFSFMNHHNDNVEDYESILLDYDYSLTLLKLEKALKSIDKDQEIDISNIDIQKLSIEDLKVLEEIIISSTVKKNIEKSLKSNNSKVSQKDEN